MAVRNPAEKYAREVLRDGKQLSAQGLVDAADNRCIADIENDAPPHVLAADLAESANWRTRLGYYRILTNQDTAGVKHAWELQAWSAVLNEEALFQSSSRYPTLSEFLERSGGMSADQFWTLAFCLWGRYSVGLMDGWTRLVSVYEACRIRGDLDVCADEEHFHFPFAVMRFLSLECIGAADLEMLDAVPQLTGVAGAWNSDSAFAAMTEKWSQWHLEFSEQRRNDAFGLAVLAHDFLFPSWIFALDKRRESELGRSALGQHHLIEHGKRLAAAIRDDNVAEPPIILAVRRKYAGLLDRGDDHLSYWRSLAGRRT